MRTLYSVLLYLAMPLVMAYLFFRGLRSRAYLSRWSERFGRFDAPARTGGIWIHAVSMGEVNAASPLINALMEAFPGTPFCITTFTPTGSDRLRELYGDTVFHVYSPLDLPGAVRRFYDRVQPRLAIIMETEIWPNLYYQCAQRGIPSLIANARISDRSLDRYRRLRWLASPALGCISRIAAQSATDADRLKSIGAPANRVEVSGNLKFDFRLPVGLQDEGETIRLSWGTQRTVLVAGSTHEKDETAILAAFTRLLTHFPQALLVLVPRHPERFSRTASAARAAGLTVSLRSEGAACPPGTQCFVVDAMGELLRYYAACDVAFVGGSMEPVGGHNVLEPAALAKPVVIGPHTSNFAEITRQLLGGGAALRVADEKELEDTLRRLFAEADARDRMGRAGYELVQSGQGAVHRTLDIVRELFIPGAG